MATRKIAIKWVFRTRFRRGAFGWRSQPAIARVREAVSEIKSAARRDKLLGAEGAVLLLEKLSPALARVDGSSGAMGAAVDGAIATLAAVIAEAPADTVTREAWLERLHAAFEADNVPWIEALGDHWGELCAGEELASRWADRLLDGCKAAWERRTGRFVYFKSTSCCLSALLAAGRHADLLELLKSNSNPGWYERRYGVRALVAMGRKAEAVRYAEEGRTRNDSPIAIARECEAILLSSGLAEEAYRRYGITANRAGTYLGWFRAVAKKYPHKTPAEILADLAAATPGEEGKWFAAAKSAGLYEEAVALANRSPCAPQTLTRAARDFREKRPEFAVEVGVAALRWLAEGIGYEVTALDVGDAYAYTMEAAQNAGCRQQTLERLRALVAGESGRTRLVTRVLGAELGLPG